MSGMDDSKTGHVVTDAVSVLPRVVSAQSLDNMPRLSSNDMKIGIAVYTEENNEKKVHHVVDGPGIKNICDFMNGKENNAQNAIPMANVEQLGQNIASQIGINSDDTKEFLQSKSADKLQHIIGSLTRDNSIDKNLNDIRQVGTDALKGLIPENKNSLKKQGGKSRTAKRRASTKHSLSSRRRSGKIKRKSRRLRRRQRQTKHRS